MWVTIRAGDTDMPARMENEDTFVSNHCDAILVEWWSAGRGRRALLSCVMLYNHGYAVI